MDQYEDLSSREQGRVSERADLLLLLLGQPRRALAAVVVAHDGDVPPNDGGGGRAGCGAALPQRARKLVRVDGRDGGRRLAGRGRQLRRRRTALDLMAT